jgi:hypothetical protein
VEQAKQKHVKESKRRKASKNKYEDSFANVSSFNFHFILCLSLLKHFLAKKSAPHSYFASKLLLMNFSHQTFCIGVRSFIDRMEAFEPSIYIIFAELDREIFVNSCMEQDARAAHYLLETGTLPLMDRTHSVQATSRCRLGGSNKT